MFGGNEADFADWDFGLPCYVGALNGDLLHDMSSSAIEPNPIAAPVIVSERERSHQIFHIFAMTTEKAARKVLR